MTPLPELFEAPLFDMAALRAAGRMLPERFCIKLADGQTLLVTELLRVLPGKRIVGKSILDGEVLLAKLFIDKKSAQRCQQEYSGIQALLAANIPTPFVVASQPLAGGGHVLLSHFLEGATTLLEQWLPFANTPPASLAALALLTPAFHLLGQLHAAGLSHEDLHFGNFLLHNDNLLLIDGDAVRVYARAPLPPKKAARDLAMLIAQLPCTWDDHLAALLEAYHSANPDPPNADQLQHALAKERRWRMRDYLDKITRDCTLFQVSHTSDRFCAVARAYVPQLLSVINRPDDYLKNGRLLKRGNTSIIAEFTLSSQKIVIKRYNIKNWRHAFSRLFRPSRAWHSWQEGHRLHLLGIPTPTPLALIEERLWLLRREAWLITDYCPGMNLLVHLSPHIAPPPAEAQALLTLFEALKKNRITHGDLKATNLLWDNDQIYLIDLDAMQQHWTQTGWQQAWQRDRERFLRNWPATSILHRWLDVHLPSSSQ